MTRGTAALLLAAIAGANGDPVNAADATVPANSDRRERARLSFPVIVSPILPVVGHALCNRYKRPLAAAKCFSILSVAPQLRDSSRQRRVAAATQKESLDRERNKPDNRVYD
jgi:hypothetical protein